MNASWGAMAKRIIFPIIMLSVPLLFVELLIRSYFAVTVSPRVFLYGTEFSRHQERFDPKGADRRKYQEQSTVVFHDNIVGTYSKYFPNQRLTDRDEFGNPIAVQINSRGFRGKDFENKKSPGVIRVVTLGASSTFGFKNHDEQTYPYYIEKMLNEALSRRKLQWNGVTITGFEVINLGVPHLRSEQIFRLFANEGVDLAPDFVTFYEGINDAAWTEPTNLVVDKTKNSIKGVPLATSIFREMRYRSLAVALIGLTISRAKEDYSLEELAQYRDGKKENFLANLQLLYELCQQNHVQLIVAGQQATNMEEMRAKLKGLTYGEEQAMVSQKLATTGRLDWRAAAFLVHKDLMEAQREWARSTKIPYADVIGAMDLHRHHLVTWVHLNDQGNKIIASVLTDHILREIASGSYRR